MPLAPVETRNIAHDEPQDYLWTMNFGPQHPATHTTLRIVLKLDGERVIDWPTNVFSAKRLDHLDRDVIIFRGMEPHLNWRTYSELFMEVYCVGSGTRAVGM